MTNAILKGECCFYSFFGNTCVRHDRINLRTKQSFGLNKAYCKEFFSMIANTKKETLNVSENFINTRHEVF